MAGKGPGPGGSIRSRWMETPPLRKVQVCMAMRCAKAGYDRVVDIAGVGAVLGERLRLDHVGVAVRSIAAARGLYEALGMAVGAEDTVEQEQVRVAMMAAGESRIELLEATTEDSVIGRFVAKRGEGLHHIAVRVPDVEAVFAQLRARGVRLASDGIGVGAGGHRYFFVHPGSAGGVLVEVVG